MTVHKLVDLLADDESPLIVVTGLVVLLFMFAAFPMIALHDLVTEGIPRRSKEEF